MFKDVDVALSSHPSSNRTIIPADIPKDQSWSLAMVGYRYAYHGKAAHAAVVPHEGINALNAVIHLFTGIDALRQHLRDDVRIHGIITDGGKAANVVPDFAAAVSCCVLETGIIYMRWWKRYAGWPKGAAQSRRAPGDSTGPSNV